MTAALLVGVAALFPLFVVFLVVKTQDALRRFRPRRLPLTKDLLRGPGHSLKAVIDATHEKAMDYVLVTFVSPIYALATAFGHRVFAGPDAPTGVYVGFVTFGIGLSVYGAIQMARYRNRLRYLRLGLDGEVAVGEELNRLMLKGCYVFHDIPADGFNVDHVVVCNRGVYAVETKTRSKPDRGEGKSEATVVFDGERLVFPNGADTAALQQATRQADWLSQWLASATGVKTSVVPVLALPGWFVDRKGRGTVRVINPREASKMFGNTAAVSDEQIQRIFHQLDRVCRDVAPVSTKAYQRKKRQMDNGARPAVTGDVAR